MSNDINLVGFKRNHSIVDLELNVGGTQSLFWMNIADLINNIHQDELVVPFIGGHKINIMKNTDDDGEDYLTASIVRLDGTFHSMGERIEEVVTIQITHRVIPGSDELEIYVSKQFNDGSFKTNMVKVELSELAAQCVVDRKLDHYTKILVSKNKDLYTITLHESACEIDSKSGNIKALGNRLGDIWYKFNLGDFDPTPTPTKETEMKIENFTAEYIGNTLSYQFTYGDYPESEQLHDIQSWVKPRDITNVERIDNDHSATTYKFKVATSVRGVCTEIELVNITNHQMEIVKSYAKLKIKGNDDVVTLASTPYIGRTQPQASNINAHQKPDVISNDDIPTKEKQMSNNDIHTLVSEMKQMLIVQDHKIQELTSLVSTLTSMVRNPTQYPQQGFYPNFVPPNFGQHMPHQPPAAPGFYPQQPMPSFNPQQPPSGYYPPAGMGQGLYPNPVPQQPTHSVVFASREEGVQQQSDSVKFSSSETPAHHTMSKSTLDQMHGLNQRVTAQQQPTATKEEIKDQAVFWSNFLK